MELTQRVAGICGLINLQVATLSVQAAARESLRESAWYLQIVACAYYSWDATPNSCIGTTNRPTQSIQEL